MVVFPDANENTIKPRRKNEFQKWAKLRYVPVAWRWSQMILTQARFWYNSIRNEIRGMQIHDRENKYRN